MMRTRDMTDPGGKSSRAMPGRSMVRFSVRVAPGVVVEPFPGFVGRSAPPMSGEGVAAEAHLRRGHAALHDARGADIGGRYPGLLAALENLPARDLILAGSIEESKSTPVFRARDLLHLDGFGLRKAAKARRAALLRAFLAEAGESVIRPPRES